MAELTPSQLDELTRQLKDEYQTLLREVRDELENAGEQHRIDLLNSEPGDVGDESVATALADFNVARVDRQVQGIRDIEAAFHRIKEETYGVCIECGNEIGFARLKAYPTAKRCIICQGKHEHEYAQEGHPTL
jgi:RNA polymerase-binding protein DksA